MVSTLETLVCGGEREIRTLDGVLPPYSLSRRAPSATRPFLHIFNASVQKQNNILFLMAEEVGFEPTKL